MSENLYNLDDTNDGINDEKLDDGLSSNSQNCEIAKELETEEHAWTGEKPKSKYSNLEQIQLYKLLFNIFANTRIGIKELRKYSISPREISLKFFVPMCILAGVSEFSCFLYSSYSSWLNTFIESIYICVSLFFGYFSAMHVACWLIGKGYRDIAESNFNKSLMLISMGSLAFFYGINNLFPILSPILTFFPLWTVYVIFKGINSFSLTKNDEIKISIIYSALVITFPLIWWWILTEIIGVK